METNNRTARTRSDEDLDAMWNRMMEATLGTVREDAAPRPVPACCCANLGEPWQDTSGEWFQSVNAGCILHGPRSAIVGRALMGLESKMRSGHKGKE